MERHVGDLGERRSSWAERSEEIGHGQVAAAFVDRCVVMNLVAVPSADPSAGDEAIVCEVGDDALRRSLGDPDLLRDVAKPDLGIVGE